MSGLADHIEGLLHEPTQVHASGVDLTLAAVQEVTSAGRVDFGGGELAAANLADVPTEKREPDDDYGWWQLDAGQYVIRLNESLAPPDGTRMRLQPRQALLERGASHPSLTVAELSPLPLSVGGAGIRLKENARVTTAVGISE